MYLQQQQKRRDNLSIPINEINALQANIGYKVSNISCVKATLRVFSWSVRLSALDKDVGWDRSMNFVLTGAIQRDISDMSIEQVEECFYQHV